jgi:hypothetical protein
MFMANPEPCGPLMLRELALVPADATIDQLARAVATAHECCEAGKRFVNTGAKWAIFSADRGGGFLRRVKADKKKLPHGEFQNWVKRTQKFGIRKAQMYMQFNRWMTLNKNALLAGKAHTLRQAFIMAHILPSDEEKKRSKQGDEFAKLRRQVRRLCNEVASHGGYAEEEKLLKELEPLKRLLVDIHTDTTP